MNRGRQAGNPRKKAGKRPAAAKNKVKLGVSRNGAYGAFCDNCGKGTYETRKKAREASRILYPGQTLSAYRCPRPPDGADESRRWHLGHLAPVVKRNKVSRAGAYGGSDPSPARPEKWGPMPAGLRATIRKPATEPSDEPTQDNQEAGVTTIGEAAKLSIAGFDRADQERYAHVNSESPLEERLALVHAAVLGYAKAHGWESYTRNRKQGLVGRANMSAILRGLFNDVRDGNKLEMLVTAMRNAATRADFIECMDAALNSELDPTWWVALRSGPRPVAEKKAPAAKKTGGVPKGTPRSPNSGRKKGSRNRTRLEVLSLAERTLKGIGRPAILQEVYKSADFPITLGASRDVMNELVDERRIHARVATPEDLASLKAAGGPPYLNPGTKVYSHPSWGREAMEQPTTWGLEPVHNPRAAKAPTQAAAPPAAPPSQESDDREAKLQRARELLGAPSFEEAADRFEKALPEIKAALEEDPDVKVVTPEELARMQGLLNSGEVLAVGPADRGKLSALQLLVRAETRIGDLEAEVEKLKRRNKHLLALVQTMEDDE